MVGIHAVSFTSNQPTQQPQAAKENKEKVQDAATAVGGTGYVAEKASKLAGRKGLQGEKGVTEVIDTTRQFMQGTGKTIKEANGFIAKFKNYYKTYFQDAKNWFKKLESSKYLSKLAKSKVTEWIASAFGGTLAVFVLISGINRAAENGTLAVCDLKDKYHQLMNS